jgi:hypothetical protein
VQTVGGSCQLHARTEAITCRARIAAQNLSGRFPGRAINTCSVIVGSCPPAKLSSGPARRADFGQSSCRIADPACSRRACRSWRRCPRVSRRQRSDIRVLSGAPRRSPAVSPACPPRSEPARTARSPRCAASSLVRHGAPGVICRRGLRIPDVARIACPTQKEKTSQTRASGHNSVLPVLADILTSLASRCRSGVRAPNRARVRIGARSQEH